LFAQVRLKRIKDTKPTIWKACQKRPFLEKIYESIMKNTTLLFCFGYYSSWFAQKTKWKNSTTKSTANAL
jgi:hypothetical protein